MEPHRYSYSPIIARPRIVWPGGARVALWIVPNIEHYEYLPAYVRTRNPWPRSPYPDVLGYGTRDYGNRVGLWRMFEIMDRYDFRCTVSLSLSVYEHYPEIREAIEARRAKAICFAPSSATSVARSPARTSARRPRSQLEPPCGDEFSW